MLSPNQTAASISGNIGRLLSHGVSDFKDSAKEISDKLISLNHAYSRASKELSEESLTHIEVCVKELSEAHKSYQNLALRIEDTINTASCQGDLVTSRAILSQLSTISHMVKSQLGGLSDSTTNPTATSITIPTSSHITNPHLQHLTHSNHLHNNHLISKMITCFRLNSDTHYQGTMNPNNAAHQQPYGSQPDWAVINNLTATTTPQIVHAEMQAMKGVLKKDFNTMGATLNSVIQTQVNSHAQFREQLRTLKTNQDRILIILEEAKVRYGRYGQLANPQGNTVDESQILRGAKISPKIELMKTKSVDKHCFWWTKKEDVDLIWPGDEYDTNDLKERSARAIAQDSLKVEVAKISSNLWEQFRGNPETCGYKVIEAWFSTVPRFKDWEVAKVMAAVRFIMPSGNRYGIPMPERMIICLADYDIYDFIIRNGGRVGLKRLGKPGFHMKIHVREECKEFYEDLFAFKTGMQNNNSWSMWPRYDGDRDGDGLLTGRKDRISMHYLDHKKNDNKIYIWQTELITQRDLWNDTARSKFTPSSMGPRREKAPRMDGVNRLPRSTSRTQTSESTTCTQ